MAYIYSYIFFLKWSSLFMEGWMTTIISVLVPWHCWSCLFASLDNARGERTLHPPLIISEDLILYLYSFILLANQLYLNTEKCHSFCLLESNTTISNIYHHYVTCFYCVFIVFLVVVVWRKIFQKCGKLVLAHLIVSNLILCGFTS